MNLRGHRSLLSLAVVMAAASGCVTTALGQGPTDQDLANNGGVNEQLDLYRNYEIQYEARQFKRPGADPAAVAEESHLSHVDAVSALAFSDDAYNYLSTSPAAAEIMEHPAVAFDGFAHSGMGETVILGVGIGGGLVTGGVAWFINTTVRDGISATEYADLTVSATSGVLVGSMMGIIIAGAYTYIVPAISTPFAVPLYRKAAGAFNEDLEDRILDGAPQGDPPPGEDLGMDDDAGDAGDAGDNDDGGDGGDAPADDGALHGAGPDAEHGPGTSATPPATPATPAPAPIAPRGT